MQRRQKFSTENTTHRSIRLLTHRAYIQADRRDAGQLPSDALNSSIPQAFNTAKDGDTERCVLNTVEPEAAKEKLQKFEAAFRTWFLSDPIRTDRLARLDNGTVNNTALR